MRRIIVVCWLTLLSAMTIFGQKKDIHILAANDIHAQIGAFPQLAAIADSLRTLYPSLLVLSAGDNRTGDPLNDMYSVSSYPMVTLMNMVGFDATALGNHDFDVNSLPPLMGLSNFSYICANITAEEEAGLHIVPTKVFDIDGVKVGIISVVQVNSQGRPDTHPDNLKGISFTLPMNAVARYEDFSRHCDATILLSHIGYEEDCQMAEAFPWLDLIIGGHSHTQLTADEPLHNGVLITQNKNKLAKVTHITLTVKNGKVVGKSAEYISVKSFPQKRKVVEAVVNYFSDSPYFKRVVGQATTPFRDRDKLTYLMCDALLAEGHGDISIYNNGGIRLDSLAAGPITMRDIYAMDPFQNEAMVMEMTGENLLKLLTTYSRGSLYHLPRVSGICCEAVIDKTDRHKDRLRRVSIRTLDNREFDISRTYRVVTNSYMASACASALNMTYESLNIHTSDILTRYLEKQGTVDYEHVDHMIVKEE